MTHAQANTSPVSKTNTVQWRPSANRAALEKRAAVYRYVREFFKQRGVLEVETPLLCRYGVTDRHIEHIIAPLAAGDGYLQSSPEFAMKRLLAAGSGPIYQICKAFRQEENGRHHHHEFTMLEWYQLDYSHHQLMEEVDHLLQPLLNSPSEKISYRTLFMQTVALDPFATDLTTYRQHLLTHQVHLSEDALASLTTVSARALLLSHVIEPLLAERGLVFIYDYPKEEAALARLSPHAPDVAERFEVYYRGNELANGFCELQNADEQHARFLADQAWRKTHQQANRPIDPYFIAALTHGLPFCSGVALGLDRLLMHLLDADHIKEVLSFDGDINP